MDPADIQSLENIFGRRFVFSKKLTLMSFQNTANNSRIASSTLISVFDKILENLIADMTLSQHHHQAAVGALNTAFSRQHFSRFRNQEKKSPSSTDEIEVIDIIDSDTDEEQELSKEPEKKAAENDKEDVEITVTGKNSKKPDENAEEQEEDKKGDVSEKEVVPPLFEEEQSQQLEASAIIDILERLADGGVPVDNFDYDYVRYQEKELPAAAIESVLSNSQHSPKTLKRATSDSSLRGSPEPSTKKLKMDPLHNEAPQIPDSHISRFSTMVSIKCINEDCEKYFETQALMKEHFIDEHQAAPYRCLLRECDQAFLEHRQLLRHIYTVHSSLAEYYCFKCNNLYKNSILLIHHMADQHEKGIFRCFVCDFTSTSRTLVFFHNLEEHDKVKLNQRGEIIKPKVTRPIPKSEPKSGPSAKSKRGKSSATSSSRSNLSNGDSEHCYTCLICQRSFSQVNEFRRHHMVHKNFCPFRCLWPDCNFTTKDHPDIRDHIKRHFNKDEHYDENWIDDFIEEIDEKMDDENGDAE